jgi:hypothetical protein
MERLAERVSDAESEVRAGLLGLLRDVVLPGLGPSALAPFLPLLMAHVTAAMTHLADAVRRAPHLFVEGFDVQQQYCPCTEYTSSAAFGGMADVGHPQADLACPQAPALLYVQKGPGVSMSPQGANELMHGMWV